MFEDMTIKNNRSTLLSLNLLSPRMRSGDELSRTVQTLRIGKGDA